MSTSASPPVAPIALQADDGEALWFLGVLATITASAETHRRQRRRHRAFAPRGAGSPLHVHSREDEWFYVTEGELTFWVGGQVISAPAGSFVYGPRGIPHTFEVTSPEAASSSSSSRPASRPSCAPPAPARSLTLPPPPSSRPDPAQLAAAAAEYGIEILGPPGIPA